MKNVAPLSGTFMATSIIGFLVSAYLQFDITWKFTMLIFFATMFIAAYISMIQGPIDRRELIKRK